MPQLICIKCEIFLKPETNGVMAVTTMNCDRKQPYEVYHADLWKCPKCDFEIVAGFGKLPELADWDEHFKENFAVLLQGKSQLYYVHEH